MSDLIVNGNFALPGGVSTPGYKQFTNVQVPTFGWTIAWVNPSTAAPTAEVQNTQADGQYLELASTLPYQISQTIVPITGQDYVFSFRAKARGGYPSKFLARLTKPNGVVVEYHIAPGPDWHTYTFCQCPTEKEVVVTFVGLGTNDGGAFLDDVHYVN